MDIREALSEANPRALFADGEHTPVWIGDADE